MDKETVKSGIASRAPWYQKITFPEFGISTTDDKAHAFDDQAWDNKIGPITIEEATRTRPEPKWRAIKDFLPDIDDKDILEIGANCGFWSFYFASCGAKRVTGLDISPAWLEKANWANQVLGYSNVSFRNQDFMAYDGSDKSGEGLLNDAELTVPLPNDVHDIIFMSTVLDHLFFPFFAIYKMLRMAREYVIIDVPQLKQLDVDPMIMRMGVPEDKSHHGFVFKKNLLLTYFERAGVPAASVVAHEYNDNANVCYVIDVRDRFPALRGA